MSTLRDGEGACVVLGCRAFIANFANWVRGGPSRTSRTARRWGDDASSILDRPSRRACTHTHTETRKFNARRPPPRQRPLPPRLRYLSRASVVPPAASPGPRRPEALRRVCDFPRASSRRTFAQDALGRSQQPADDAAVRPPNSKIPGSHCPRAHPRTPPGPVGSPGSVAPFWRARCPLALVCMTRRDRGPDGPLPARQRRPAFKHRAHGPRVFPHI